MQYPGAIYHVMNGGDRREATYNEAELEALGWQEQDLLGRRKGDPQKVRSTARLRRETTVTLDWIDARQVLGAPTYGPALLHRYERKETNSEEALF
jgi:hypothetical protein